MTGIATPPAPGASAAPVASVTPVNDIEQAGKDFLASLTEEERNRPLADPDEELAPDGTAAPAASPAAPVPAEAATDVGEVITRDDGAEWNEESERWTLNGKFVAGAAPEGWERPTGAPASAEPGKPASEAAAPNAPVSEAVKVTLPGLADRGETDIEVEVDKDLADRIQRLKNDGLRAQQFQARSQRLESRESQIEAYEQEMAVDPIGFHLNRLPKDQQIEVARALLVEHLETLAPEIERLSDGNVRVQAMRDLNDSMKTSRDRLAVQRQVSAATREILRVVESIVPDGTDDATFNDFVADARRDLAAAVDAGERVTPQTAKQLLARRIARYGFDKTPAPAAAPKAPAAAVPTARPVTDRARDIANRRPAPSADAANPNARIRRVQAARAAGARVAPVGPGAAPTQTIAVPPEAEADIASMSRHLRKQGLPDSWAARE